MSTISSQNPTTVVTIATPGPRGPQGPPSPAGDISGSLELTGSLIASGSFVDFSGATYVTGSFTGSYTGSFVGDGSGITGPNLSPYAVLTGSNQFSGSNHFNPGDHIAIKFTTNNDLPSSNTLEMLYTSVFRYKID